MHTREIPAIVDIGRPDQSDSIINNDQLAMDVNLVIDHSIAQCASVAQRIERNVVRDVDASMLCLQSLVDRIATAANGFVLTACKIANQTVCVCVCVSLVPLHFV
jgi:hypothetical protein